MLSSFGTKILHCPIVPRYCIECYILVSVCFCITIFSHDQINEHDSKYLQKSKKISGNSNKTFVSILKHVYLLVVIFFSKLSSIVFEFYVTIIVSTKCVPILFH